MKPSEQSGGEKKQFKYKHDWKRWPGITTCKNCGLVKGSGDFPCEAVKPDEVKQ